MAATINTSQIVVHGTVKPDGTLELNQRVNLPPGEVQVTVEQITTPPAKENVWTVLNRIWDAQNARGFVPRSREKIDAEINAMRAEADEAVQTIERNSSGHEQSRKNSN